MNERKRDDDALPPAPGPESWSAAEAADWEPDDGAAPDESATGEPRGSHAQQEAEGTAGERRRVEGP